jgi:uncharacterized peroxidase-related enzyme
VNDERQTRQTGHKEDKMNRLKRIAPEQATGRTRELLDQIKRDLGMVPNLFRLMANSPAVLEAYLGFSGALAKGALEPKLRERLALTVAQGNGCDYCLAAHNAIGRLTGLTDEEIADSRRGAAPDRRADAVLKFARLVLARRGRVDDADVSRLRAAGLSDGEIAEVAAGIALNIFTNYFNLITAAEVDFPVPEPLVNAT